jgi:hypothetical protein
MLSTCLNENDAQVKRDIAKYGREQVYRKFIENNYVYPTNFEDSVSIKLDAAKTYLKSILPDVIGVENMDRILPLVDQQGIRGNLLGTFFQDVIYLGESTNNEVMRHEAFHAVFQRLLTPEQQSELQIKGQLALAERLKKSSNAGGLNSNINQLLKDRRSRGLYEGLSDERAKKLLYEEELAEQYAAYQERSPRNLVEQLFNWLKNLTRIFNETNDLKRLFQQIDRGYFVNHKVNEHPLSTSGVIRFPLNAGTVPLSDGEKNELVRAVSNQALLNGDVEQTLSDLNSEYVVSSQQIYDLGKLKGYTEDEIFTELDNLEQEILSNKGFPVLYQILQSPEETDRLKKAVENFSSQFVSPIEQYIATATDSTPIVTNQSESFQGRRLSYPSTTELDRSVIYRTINEIAQSEGSLEEKMIEFYDRSVTNPEINRFFNQFLSDIFGENKNAAIDTLIEGEIPNQFNLEGSRSTLLNEFIGLFGNSEALTRNISMIEFREESREIFNDFFKELGERMDSEGYTIYDSESVENSKQEVCL